MGRKAIGFIVLCLVSITGLAPYAECQMRLSSADVNLQDVDVYEYSYRNWNNANWGVWSGMTVGTNIAGQRNTRRRVYIRFDVNSLRALAGMPNSVALELSANLSDGSYGDVNVYRVTEPWAEGNGTYHSGQVEPSARAGMITWSHQPRFDAARIWSKHRFTQNSGGRAWASIDISKLVQEWMSGGSPNYGLVLVAANETGDRFKVDFSTSESERADLRPRLMVDGHGGGGGGGGSGEGGQLKITFCDGSTQTVQLNQSAGNISSLDLGCNNDAPPSVPSVREVHSDASWKCSARDDEYGWRTAEFSDSHWRNASAPWPNSPNRYAPQKVRNMENTAAQWIWLEGDPDLVYCRKEFSVGPRVSNAELRISVDNYYHVYINGALVGKEASDPNNNWQSAEIYDVTQYLRPGVNVIAVEGQDLGGGSGILAEVQIR